MHHTRINFLITREIQNNFVELNHTRDEKVDTRVMHFQEQPSSPGSNHTITGKTLPYRLSIVEDYYNVQMHDKFIVC